MWSSQAGLIDLNTKVTNLPGDVVLIGAFSINENCHRRIRVEKPQREPA